MWRLGVSGEEKSKHGKHEKNKQPVGSGKRAPRDKPTDKKKSMRMLRPEVEPGGRRGSLMAAEHLLRRRGSRASRNFNAAEFAQFATGAIPLELTKTQQQNVRRSSVVTTRMNKVKEIQDRVNKAVKDYESSPLEEAKEAGYLVKDIEENLFNIEDDMIRINVSILLEKFRKMTLQRNDELRYLNDSQGGERKKELLESLQTWMEENHMEDLEDDEPTSKSPIPDAEAVRDSLDQIEQNLKRVSSLEEKIRQLQRHGDDTAFLERQKKNLSMQLKQDVLDDEFRRRHSQVGNEDGSGGGGKEFTYLKNAATEIYDLLNKTRMEGMAHSHQFEENLKRILLQLDEKDKDIEYLEKRVKQQKMLVKQWYGDYEKLQNDHFLTKDEILEERKRNKKLQSDIETMKKNKMAGGGDKGSKAAQSKQDAEKAKEREQHFASVKQKLEVVNWALKEKEQLVDEQQRQIQQLKNALRKNSTYCPTESLYKPVAVEKSGSSGSKRNSSTNVPSTKDSGTRMASLVPPPTPNNGAGGGRELEVEILKSKLAGIELENKVLTENVTKMKDDFAKHTPKVVAAKNTQTDEVTEDTVPSVITRSQAVQADPVPALQFKKAKERRQLYQSARRMQEKLGDNWSETALMMTELEPDDVSELEHGLTCENDYIRMFSGSPTNQIAGDEEGNDEKRKIDELREARDDLISCRVTSSVQQLTEQMLMGKDPQILEQNNLAGIKTIHSEMEGMIKHVSGFVNKIQAVIGCQTGMMNEANEAIKRSLPSQVQNKLDKGRAKNGTRSQMSLSCSEHSQEWKDMSLGEQIRCKLKVVEESMRANVHGAMNVYINEVAKQHAEYSDIHTSVNDDPRLEVKQLIPNTDPVIRTIQNKVESSVRYMARVTRAERGAEPSPIKRNAMSAANQQAGGEGNAAAVSNANLGRQAGTYKSVVGKRKHGLSFGNAGNADDQQQPLSLFGHATIESGGGPGSYKKKHSIHGKPATAEVTGRATTRQGQQRDFHLLHPRRNKLKPELRGLGMVVKSSPIQKEFSTPVGKPQTAMNLIHRTGTAAIPISQSYQDPRVTRDMTLNELQNQLTSQIPNMKPGQQQQNRRPQFDRHRGIPGAEPGAISPNMVVGHLTKALNPLSSGFVREVKLPKIF